MHTRGLVALCLTLALGCGGGTSPAEPESSSGEERVVVEKPGEQLDLGRSTLRCHHGHRRAMIQTACTMPGM